MTELWSKKSYNGKNYIADFIYLKLYLNSRDIYYNPKMQRSLRFPFNLLQHPGDQ